MCPRRESDARVPHSPYRSCHGASARARTAGSQVSLGISEARDTRSPPPRWWGRAAKSCASGTRRWRFTSLPMSRGRRAGTTTGLADEAFRRGPLLHLLVETARYWASRIECDADGSAHIRHVIGPDEYHDDVDDNAFTNVMARWNLRAAATRAGAMCEEREVRQWKRPRGCDRRWPRP